MTVPPCPPAAPASAPAHSVTTTPASDSENAIASSTMASACRSLSLRWRQNCDPRLVTKEILTISSPVIRHHRPGARWRPSPSSPSITGAVAAKPLLGCPALGDQPHRPQPAETLVKPAQAHQSTGSEERERSGTERDVGALPRRPCAQRLRAPRRRHRRRHGDGAYGSDLHGKLLALHVRPRGARLHPFITPRNPVLPPRCVRRLRHPCGGSSSSRRHEPRASYRSPCSGSWGPRRSSTAPCASGPRRQASRTVSHRSARGLELTGLRQRVARGTARSSCSARSA